MLGGRGTGGGLPSSSEEVCNFGETTEGDIIHILNVVGKLLKWCLGGKDTDLTAVLKSHNCEYLINLFIIPWTFHIKFLHSAHQSCFTVIH